MAEVIQLKDGKVHTIFDSKDFKWLVEQYMGYEASRYFENLIDGFEQAIADAQDKTKSDLGSYEASLESNTRAFQDILEEVNQIETIIQAKRLQKDKLSKSVQEVRKIINNQI